VFQRTANFSIPARNEPLAPEVQREWKDNYPERRSRAKQEGTLYEINDKRTREVSVGEREREYQRRWDRGGAVNFMQSFRDVMVDREANNVIAEFVRAQIRATVKDPETAASLCPTDHPLGSKRICLDTGYFETYNRANVRLVDLKKTPILEVVPEGVRTAAGGRATETLHELDALVCATGYDALTGALLAMDIRGRGGLTLREKWDRGPRSLLGIMTRGFPNLFIITGAGSPSVLSNMVVGVEHHVDWICDCLRHLREQGLASIEADGDAEDRWVEHVNAAAHKTLFPLANSWYMGANIPGKPRVFMPYVVRFGKYRRECQEVADRGYEGFVLGRAE
jgi:cyclohexanone monooxygenase